MNKEGFDLQGHKFIITGAGRGIGRGIGQRLSELGALISGWDLDVSEIRRDPAFAHAVEMDVTDEASTAHAVEESVSALGGLHGMVASAGINGPTKPTWEYSLSEWRQVMEVDLTGVFLSTRAVLPHLRVTGYGRLVIIASVAAKEGNPGAVPYGAAKAGVVGYAKGLARELMPADITVNCIAPAITETDLVRGMSPEYIAEKKSRIPMGRFCSVSEIADMTAWVASPRCSFTTGQVFDVTGGRTTY
ncbi:MAG: SDR family NAD(P)-dependent oxidoreductase [bacterium]